MPDSPRPASLRRLSELDAPLPGLLMGGYPPSVWTDGGWWEGTPAWCARPDGHILAPIDAGFDENGYGVIVPYCPDRLRLVLARRLELAAGEAVTIAVSLLRGTAEADELGVECGAWWVTADGRPVCATGGTGRVREEAVELFEELTAKAPPALRPALSDASEIVAEPRRLQLDSLAAEDALFARADPLPLSTAHVPVRARALAPSRTPDEAKADADVPSPVYDFLRRHVDAVWAERVEAVWRDLANRLPRRDGSRRDPATRSSDATRDRHDGADRQKSARRRAPLVLACGVGATLLALGLALPESADEQEVDPTAATSDSREATPMPSPTPEASTLSAAGASDADDDDLATQGERLIKRLAACASAGCGDDVLEDPSRSFPRGPATSSALSPVVRVLDGYGGVAALRVSAGGVHQVVVVVRNEDRWLVRDVYDVADQPR